MASQRQTWDLDDFGSGIDLRDGLWSRNQARLRELVNCRITKGRKIRRRPPCILETGAFDGNSKGLVSVDGQFYAFAKKGDAITHTGAVAAKVQTLYFDNPDYCTGWELLYAQVFNGYAVALIQHVYPSTQYPVLVQLHVWDDLAYAPTYVQDPYLPGLFSPSIADLTDQQYDSTFIPALGQGATKLWTSTLRGNAHASRTADARVWNQRTLAGLKEDGEQYCFIVPEGIGAVRRFLVPRDAATLKVDARWSYYVLEKATGTTWVPMTEVDVAPTVNGTWQAVSVASRFAGGWNEIAVDVKWDSASAGLVRLRLVAGAPGVEVTGTQPLVTVVAGSGSAWKLNVAAATWRHRGGDGQTTVAHDTAELTSGRTYLLAVTSENGTFPELVDITSSFPNGWELEHRAFIKKVVVPAAQTGATAANAAWSTYTTLTGTVEVVAAANGIAGVGTNFDPEIDVGSVVRINGEIKTIATRTNDTTATIVGTWAGSAGPGATIELQVPHYATFTGGDTQVSITLTTLVAGNNLRINGRDYAVKEVVSPGVYKVTYAGASGNYVSFLDAAYAAYLTDQPVVTDYLYAYESDQDNAWYVNLILEYGDMAGAEDALSINTAAHDNTGGKITSIASIRQRMLITYEGSMQLWAIDQDTSRTTFLDALNYGTGPSTIQPAAVAFYGSMVLRVSNGIRSISVVGANTDNFQDLNIGEPIESMKILTAQAAAFWPYFGQLVFAVQNEALEYEFRVFDYSRESKISAWSVWNPGEPTGIPVAIDTMIPIGSDLWFRSGDYLRRFDAATTTLRDSGETAGNAYLSSAVFHYNDMGKPGMSKRFVAFDVVQEGTSAVGFNLPSYEIAGQPLAGTTYGRARLPISLTAQAIAPTFASRDETGWELQRVAVDFLMLRR